MLSALITSCMEVGMHKEVSSVCGGNMAGKWWASVYNFTAQTPMSSEINGFLHILYGPTLH